MLTGAIVVLGAQQGEQQRPGLSAQGVAVWPDDLSRELLAGGELEPLVADRHVVGITTNPAIFPSALSAGDRYDSQLRNVTLIFSLDRYLAVMEAYLAGLEGAAMRRTRLGSVSPARPGQAVAEQVASRLVVLTSQPDQGHARAWARCRGNRSGTSGVPIDSSSIVPRLALNKASRRRYPVSLDQVSHAAGTRAGLAETAELAAAGKRA